MKKKKEKENAMIAKWTRKGTVGALLCHKVKCTDFCNNWTVLALPNQLLGIQYTRLGWRRKGHSCWAIIMLPARMTRAGGEGGMRRKWDSSRLASSLLVLHRGHSVNVRLSLQLRTHHLWCHCFTPDHLWGNHKGWCGCCSCYNS